ncbi:hypothetical protein [uncultured Caballeronia sp.]|uniref:hypothetical protein n=1 Tax=uncultured Caballeronia sp. TaxID=1827198 RepID=UPI0035CA3C01
MNEKKVDGVTWTARHQATNVPNDGSNPAHVPPSYREQRFLNREINRIYCLYYYFSGDLMHASTTKSPSKKAAEILNATPIETTPAAPVAISKRKASAKAVEAATEVQAKAVKVPVKSKVKTAPAEPDTHEKPKRAKKEKVVRDSFTMPKSDYDKIAALKQKCLANGVHVKKGELLRAGLLILEAANIEQLTAAVAAVETVKTGRPVKS